LKFTLLILSAQAEICRNFKHTMLYSKYQVTDSTKLNFFPPTTLISKFETKFHEFFRSLGRIIKINIKNSSIIQYGIHSNETVIKHPQIKQLSESI